ncbi:hypothetical protein B0J18DRAFT_148278 [Chaetomium sp. MPI-SDFR-AT-0129]|nr:hypothetical protein B0J18DRAFT_148278 [Chaetomium sp. MPI-SDFR-AT-0129]
MPLRQTAANWGDFALHQFDRFVPPQQRQDAYDRAKAFAIERPFLFAFLLAQGFFSAIPLILFTTFTLSTLFTFATIFLCATLFWMGIALLVLVPTLFLTGSLALFIWSFGATAFITSRAAYATFLVMTEAPKLERREHHREVKVTEDEVGRDGDRKTDQVSTVPSASSSSGASWTRIESQETRDVKQEGEEDGRPGAGGPSE